VFPHAVAHHRQLLVRLRHARGQQRAQVLRLVVQLEGQLPRPHLLQQLVDTLRERVDEALLAAARTTNRNIPVLRAESAGLAPSSAAGTKVRPAPPPPAAAPHAEMEFRMCISIYFKQVKEKQTWM